MTSPVRPEPEPLPPHSVRRILAGPLRRIQYIERELSTVEIVVAIILARRKALGIRKGPRAARLERELIAGVRYVEAEGGAIVRASEASKRTRLIPSRHALGKRTRHVEIPRMPLVWLSPLGCPGCALFHPRDRCPFNPAKRRHRMAKPRRGRRPRATAQLREIAR